MSIYSDAVLILKPSGYKAAELYSVVPNTSVGDFDVARSSTTTRINASGYIEQVAANVPRLNYDSGDSCPYLLTESASTNLITYPISFGNSYWTKSGASIEGDESNLTTAVYTSDFSSDNDSFVYNRLTANANVTIDGVDDALRVTLFSGDGTHNMYSDRTKEGFSFLNSSDSDLYSVSFDVYIPSSNAKVDGIRFSYGGDYTPLTDTWTTYNVVVNPDLTYFYFFALDGANTVIDSDGDMFYIKNITFKQVQGFEAPKVDGSGGFEREAYKLVEDTSNGTHRVYANVTVTAEIDYTPSVYIKADEVTKVRIIENAIIGVPMSIKADLALGTITYDGTQVDSSSITELTNGWYRLSMSGATNAGQTLYRYEISLLDDSGSDSYTGDGTSGVYIAYAQLEESNYASSLMLPTTEGSTTSRVADAITNAGNQSLFSNVNSSGTLYAEIAANSDDLTYRQMAISDGTNSNYVRLYYDPASNTITARITVATVSVAEISYTVSDPTVFAKCAVRWRVNDFSLWTNGVERGTDVSGVSFAASTLTEFSFDGGGGTENFYGKTKALAVFDYLSDTEMVTLTT